jgi:hypothetical protein
MRQKGSRCPMFAYLYHCGRGKHNTFETTVVSAEFLNAQQSAETSNSSFFFVFLSKRAPYFLISFCRTVVRRDGETKRKQIF